MFAYWKRSNPNPSNTNIVSKMSVQPNSWMPPWDDSSWHLRFAWLKSAITNIFVWVQDIKPTLVAVQEFQKDWVDTKPSFVTTNHLATVNKNIVTVNQQVEKLHGAIKTAQTSQATKQSIQDLLKQTTATQTQVINLSKTLEKMGLKSNVVQLQNTLPSFINALNDTRKDLATLRSNMILMENRITASTAQTGRNLSHQVNSLQINVGAVLDKLGVDGKTMAIEPME